MTIKLYGEDDKLRTKSALRKALIAFAIAFALMLSTVIAMLIVRNRFIAMGVGVVGAWVSFYLFMNKVMPWLRYRRFLRDMDEGLSRNTDGFFVAVSESARMADGICVHDMAVRDAQDESIEMLFLWDDDKPLPKFEAGAPVHIVSFSNFVKEIHSAG